MSVPTLGRPNGEVAVNLHLPLALSLIVGAAAGYGAAKIYPRPFDMAVAAEPRGMAAPSPAAIVRAQVTQQPSPPLPGVPPRAQSVADYPGVTCQAAGVKSVQL